nr:hypothetical protein [uncultured Desulfobulbus sp.]
MSFPNTYDEKCQTETGEQAEQDDERPDSAGKIAHRNILMKITKKRSDPQKTAKSHSPTNDNRQNRRLPGMLIFWGLFSMPSPACASIPL